MDTMTGPGGHDEDTRTYGERLEALREQLENEGLIDPGEVLELLNGLKTFKGQRLLVLDSDAAAYYNERDGLESDIEFLQSLLPDMDGQMQFTP